MKSCLYFISILLRGDLYLKRYFKVRINNPERNYHGAIGDVVNVNFKEEGLTLIPESFLVNITDINVIKKMGYSDLDIKKKSLDVRGVTVLVDVLDTEKI